MPGDHHPAARRVLAVPQGWPPGTRSRLLAAMAQVVAEAGFVETRVEDVLAAAGASRRTFYEHFENREECLLAAYDQVRDDALVAMTRGDGLEGALAGLFEYIAAWPAHGRLLTFEILAAGPPGLDRHEATMGGLAAQLRRCRERRDTGEDVLRGDELVHAAVGGLHRIVHRRLVAGQERTLPELAPAAAQLVRARL